MMNKKNILIIGAMVVVTVIAFLLINLFSGKGPITTNNSEVNKENLTKEIVELEGNLLELEVIFEQKDKEVENFETLLQESYSRLDGAESQIKTLEEKVAQLKRQGKVDSKTIQELESRVNDAKAKFAETKNKKLEAEINLLVRENGDLTAKTDSFELLNYQKDSILAALEKEMDACATLAASQSTNPIPVDDPPIATPVVDKKEDPGFYAEIEGFNFYNAKGDRLKTSTPKSKKLEALEINLTLRGVEPVKQGQHDIYVVITDALGKTITNPNSNQSKIPFSYQGRQVISTTKSFFNYTGRVMKFPIPYKTGGEFPSGRSTVNVYYGNKLLATRRLIVQQ